MWGYYFNMITDKGGEGIVMKRSDAPYYWGKRNHSLLKLKQEIEADLLVTALSHGVGKKGEPSMNLYLTDRIGTRYTVVVAKDADRSAYTEDNNKILGKVVKVVAMERLPSGLLREPRLCKSGYLREDKYPSDID
jgi:ATP-dependent DNA ligase